MTPWVISLLAAALLSTLDDDGRPILVQDLVASHTPPEVLFSPLRGRAFRIEIHTGAAALPVLPGPGCVQLIEVENADDQAALLLRIDGERTPRLRLELEPGYETRRFGARWILSRSSFFRCRVPIAFSRSCEISLDGEESSAATLRVRGTILPRGTRIEAYSKEVPSLLKHASSQPPPSGEEASWSGVLQPNREHLVLALDGPACALRFEVRAQAGLELRLRMSFDGEIEPSIDLPLDAVISKHAVHPFRSEAPVFASEDGIGWTLPMPFADSLRVTLESRAAVPVPASIRVRWARGGELPEDARLQVLPITDTSSVALPRPVRAVGLISFREDRGVFHHDAFDSLLWTDPVAGVRAAFHLVVSGALEEGSLAASDIRAGDLLMLYRHLSEVPEDPTRPPFRPDWLWVGPFVGPGASGAAFAPTLDASPSDLDWTAQTFPLRDGPVGWRSANDTTELWEPGIYYLATEVMAAREGDFRLEGAAPLRLFVAGREMSPPSAKGLECLLPLRFGRNRVLLEHRIEGSSPLPRPWFEDPAGDLR